MSDSPIKILFSCLHIKKIDYSFMQKLLGNFDLINSINACWVSAKWSNR